ncbi:cytochrome C oxidase subunit IV family protein [Ohtaekwangia sp.]|uniref:cytochrome C oxidase subunit IV family protein n=1 Tax=Ohtaekwangia sp. TaxID=2066019 RepID=UPI002FDEBD58
MAHAEETVHVNVLPPDHVKIRKLWMTALILLVITVIEFIVAFTISHEYKDLRVWIFITMTIVKAAYIVGEFMHLRYEVKVLIWSILIPMIFVVWMLVAFLYEGMAISAVR